MATPIKLVSASPGLNLKNFELKEQYHVLGPYTSMGKCNVVAATYDGNNVLIETTSGKRIVIHGSNFKGMEIE